MYVQTFIPPASSTIVRYGGAGRPDRIAFAAGERSRTARFSGAAARGLGALSVQQTYDFARKYFPADVARQMVAIAQRESGLNPGARCDSCLGVTENSIGLWQINFGDAANRALLNSIGITSAAQLTDPDTNARAAAALWGGSASNLNTAWSINRYGTPYGYAEKYNSFLSALPDVSTLEAASGAGTAGAPVDLASVFSPLVSAVADDPIEFDSGIGPVLLGAFGLGLLIWMAS